MQTLLIGEEPGIVLEVTDLGATVLRLLVTDRDGERRNVMLNHGTAQDYLDGSDFRGAVVGRFANRIAGGRFELDGRAVELAANEGPNTLHGGPDGFHRREWEVDQHERDHVRLSLVSPDGDQGFPGELTATASYTVSADRVRVELSATCDAPTLVNLTSHVYWNLDGSTTIDDHRLLVEAASYLPLDARGIPTGEVAPIDASPYSLDGSPVADRAVDHCFVLSGGATLETDHLRMDLTTDRPGLQVYTGDFLGDTPRRGLALEPQLFPDAPHHPHFPSAVLRPGETSRAWTEWRFL